MAYPYTGMQSAHERVTGTELRAAAVPSAASIAAEGSDTFKIAYEISNHCDF